MSLHDLPFSVRQWLGDRFGEGQEWSQAGFGGRRLKLKKAMSAVRAYEAGLSRSLIQAVQSIPGTHIYGATDPQRLDERVPTVSFTWGARQPRRVAEQGLYVWDGNYYALAVTERLNIEDKGGMIRVGPVHYNTVEEITRFGTALQKIAG